MLGASALLDTLSTTIPLVPPFSPVVCVVVLGIVPLIPSKDWAQPADAHKEPPPTVTPANNLSVVPFLSSLKGRTLCGASRQRQFRAVLALHNRGSCAVKAESIQRWLSITDSPAAGIKVTA